jgi:hypothetical protein
VRQIAEAVAPVDDGVEALLGQRANVALLEADGEAALGGQPSRLRHLLLGDVDARDARARSESLRAIRPAPLGASSTRAAAGRSSRLAMAPASSSAQGSEAARQNLAFRPVLKPTNQSSARCVCTWVLPFGSGEEGANQRAEPAAGCCKRIGLKSSSRGVWRRA